MQEAFTASTQRVDWVDVLSCIYNCTTSCGYFDQRCGPDSCQRIQVCRLDMDIIDTPISLIFWRLFLRSKYRARLVWIMVFMHSISMFCDRWKRCNLHNKHGKERRREFDKLPRQLQQSETCSIGATFMLHIIFLQWFALSAPCLGPSLAPLI